MEAILFVSLLLMQAAAQLPDIEIRATMKADALTIQKNGEASLIVHSAPDGGNVVEVQAPKANGRKTIRNVAVDVRAEARIAADKIKTSAGATTSRE